jgi:hypothetical protein
MCLGEAGLGQRTDLSGGRGEFGLPREEAPRLAAWWPGLISFTLCQLILKRRILYDFFVIVSELWSSTRK